MYTSRRGFTPEGALTYGLSGMFGPRACSGDGLGDGETSSDCAQPVSGEERAALIAKAQDWTGDYYATHGGEHFHEGHPDLKAALADIIPRLDGLVHRPKLVRCDAEARKRINEWVGALEDLDRRAHAPAGQYRGKTPYVHVDQPFKWSFYRGPTYTIRASSDPAVQASQAAFAGRGPAVVVPPVSSAPPGSVVVGGVVYANAAEAAAAERARQAAQTPSGVPSPVAPPSTGAPGAAAPVLAVPVPETVAGIPTQYFLYGALAFLAFRMLGGK